MNTTTTPQTSAPLAVALVWAPQTAGAAVFLRPCGPDGTPTPEDCPPMLIGWRRNTRPAPVQVDRMIRRGGWTGAGATEKLRQREYTVSPPGAAVAGWRVFLTEAAGPDRVARPLWRVDVMNISDLLDGLPADGGPEIPYYVRNRKDRTAKPRPVINGTSSGGADQAAPGDFIPSISTNVKLRGIELRFASKPPEDVRVELKSGGWKWGRFNSCWYRKPKDASEAEKIFRAALELQRLALYIWEDTNGAL